MNDSPIVATARKELDFGATTPAGLIRFLSAVPADAAITIDLPADEADRGGHGAIVATWHLREVTA